MTAGRTTDIARTRSTETRQRVADGLASLNADYRRLRQPARYPVSVSTAVEELTQQTRDEIGSGQSSLIPTRRGPNLLPGVATPRGITLTLLTRSVSE